MAAYKNYKEIPISSIKFNDEIIAWAVKKILKIDLNLIKVYGLFNVQKNFLKRY